MNTKPYEALLDELRTTLPLDTYDLRPEPDHPDLVRLDERQRERVLLLEELAERVTRDLETT